LADFIERSGDRLPIAGISPIEGCALAVIGSIRRRGILFTLACLHDGSRALIPAQWTVEHLLDLNGLSFLTIIRISGMIRVSRRPRDCEPDQIQVGSRPAVWASSSTKHSTTSAGLLQPKTTTLGAASHSHD